MALEGCEKNPQSLLLSPPLLFLRSEDDKEMSFCSIANIGDPIDSVEILDELRDKDIVKCYFDWFVLVDRDGQYSLWNPFTLELKTLPRLDLMPEHKINDCIVTSPPTSGDSSLILFDKSSPSIIHCKLGYEEWTHHLITEDFMQDNYFICPFMCNGVLYTLTNPINNLVRIDLNMLGHIQLVEDELLRPLESRVSVGIIRHILEIAGEIWCITLFLGVVVDYVQVLKLDLSKMRFIAVESFKDRAFFVSHGAVFSCRPFGSKIKGNHVYFTLSCDKNVYSFSMDNKTISISVLHLNFQNLKHQPIWIWRNVDRQNEDYDKYEEDKKFGNKKLVRHSSITNDDARGDFGKLCGSILFEIGKRLILGDYISFRFCNKECRAACPQIQCTSAHLEGFEDNASRIPPWLISWQFGNAICHCFDLLHHEQYFLKLPNNTLKDVLMIHSSSGWCVMLHEEISIFLWNPFTKKIIELPELAYNREFVIGCTLTPKKNFVFIIYEWDNHYLFEIISLEKEEWISWTWTQDLDIIVEMDTSFAFYKEHLYLFEPDGKMVVFKLVRSADEIKLELQYKVETPCYQSHQSFVMECDDKILSIFVGSSGDWIRIFILDCVEKDWVEIENINNKTLYISRFACLSTTPSTHEMGNRIYLPRFHCDDNGIVYYSLNTKKLHIHGTEEVLESFHNTKRHVSSSWIEVKWW